MTTVGRWSPNKVRARVLDGTWVSPEELGGMVLLTPTSIAYTGTSAIVGANGSVEFSGVSSLSLNGVFSSTYDNYVISVRSKNDTGGGNISYRLRSNGADNSTTNSYVSQYFYGGGGTRAAGRIAGTVGYFGTTDQSKTDGYLVHFYGPYLVQPTASRSRLIAGYSQSFLVSHAVTHNQATSYDGITLFGTYTITGFVSVYGLVGA